MCILFLENYIKNYNTTHYEKNGQDYLKEIDADIYSITKIESFLKKHNLYNEEKNMVKKMKTTYQLRKLNYDFDKIWEEFHRLYTEEIKNNKIKEKDEPLNILINILFKPNTSQFKNITQILQNKDIDIVSEELIYSILMSNSFIEKLNIEKLSNEELKILKELTKYNIKVTKEKLKYTSNINRNEVLDEKELSNIIKRTKQKLNNLNKLLASLELKETEKIIENHKIRR